MLVLSRKVGEEIVITVPPSAAPQTIVVRQVEVRNDRGRIGVTAERTVSVHRREVYEDIQRQSKGGK